MDIALAAKKAAKPLWIDGVSVETPGEFRFVTKAVQMEPPGEGGRRRFKMIASSTIVDDGKDEIKLSALHDLEQAFKAGRNIFTDHKHTVDSVFGRTDDAQIMDSGLKDAKTGAPIYDLHVAGVVNEPDPHMVQLADSIDGGFVTFGASIGARVLEHQRNKAGGMDIYHLDGKEASLVGIPMNQRSWTYKAAKAAEMLDAANPDEDEDDDAPVVEAAAPEDLTVKDVATDIPTAESAETDDAADETSPEITDGQESEPAPETPETASAETEDDEDAPTIEAAFAFESDDVVKLASHVQKLAQTVSDRDAEIEALKAERDTLAEENSVAKQVIEKMVSMPLRSKTAGYVEDTLVKRLPSFLAPEVKDYLSKNASGDTK